MIRWDIFLLRCSFSNRILSRKNNLVHVSASIGCFRAFQFSIFRMFQIFMHRNMKLSIYVLNEILYASGSICMGRDINTDII